MNNRNHSAKRRLHLVAHRTKTSMSGLSPNFTTVVSEGMQRIEDNWAACFDAAVKSIEASKRTFGFALPFVSAIDMATHWFTVCGEMQLRMFRLMAEQTKIAEAFAMEMQRSFSVGSAASHSEPLERSMDVVLGREVVTEEQGRTASRPPGKIVPIRTKGKRKVFSAAA